MSDKKVYDMTLIRSEKLAEKKIERVWECQCGGQLFWLLAHGAIMCRSCNLINNDTVWGERTP